MTNIPKIPALLSIAESSAVPGSGAAGYDCGSQVCNGNLPAFTPNPTSTRAHAHTRVTSLMPVDSMAGIRASISRVPKFAWSMKRPISVASPPNTAKPT